MADREWASSVCPEGREVNGRGEGPAKETPLHSAAWNGDLAMVRLLVEAGADPEARDREHDNTALGWAETALGITNNPRCAEVAAYLRTPTPPRCACIPAFFGRLRTNVAV